MRNELLNKSQAAEGAIAAYRIVKFGAADGNVLQATGPADKLIGVNDRIPFAGSGERGDICRIGICEVEYGGTVAAGDALTSDAQGRAVTAAPAAGTNNRVIGFAEVAGVLGDIGSLTLSPCVVQG